MRQILCRGAGISTSNFKKVTYHLETKLALPVTAAGIVNNSSDVLADCSLK